MSGIKLSSLSAKLYEIKKSRKSKGKLNFIQKIKYFYLMNKYSYFGLKGFSDIQLAELITMLNARQLTYNMAVKELEKEKKEVDENLANTLEQIGSADPSEFKKNGTKDLLEAANRASDIKDEIDEEIKKNNHELDVIESIKDEISDEIEHRNIEKEKEATRLEEVIKELNKNKKEEKQEEPVKEATEEVVETTEEKKEEPQESIEEEPKKEEDNQTAFNFEISIPNIKLDTNIKEEPKVLEGVSFPVFKEMDENDINNLEERIIANAEQPVEEDVYSRITREFNELMNKNAQEFSNAFHKMFVEFNKQVAKATMEVCARIQEEDRKESQSIINNLTAEKDAIIAEKVTEIANRDAEIANKNQEISNLTNSNNNLTDELKNANDEIARLKEELAASKAEEARKEQTIAELNVTVEKDRVDISNLEKANTVLRETVITSLQNIPGITPVAPTEGGKTM